MKNIENLEYKQLKLMQHLELAGEKFFRIKINTELSPIGWHIVHCLYVECFWIRSYFLGDNELVDKLKKTADSISNSKKNRGLNLPDFNVLFSFCKDEFKTNLNIIEDLLNKKNKENIIYFLSFLINHHSQHLETIKIIMNLINIKINKNTEENFSTIEPQEYKYNPVNFDEQIILIGTNHNKPFSYDNEKPQNEVKLKEFSIDKNLIQVNQWLGFMISGGYRKKDYWSKKGWLWKNKNNILKPLNWQLEDNQISISTPYGYKKPKKNNAVTNISFYELEAFANWQKLKIPHEYEWETASEKLLNKFIVWEWSRNLFFPYNGFNAYPYEEYSSPWFNKDYYSLKGSSSYSEKEVKRITFRNFYKPNSRYIFSGGRLSLN